MKDELDQLTVNAARKWAALLPHFPTDSVAADTEIILQHCLEKPRSFLYTWPEHLLTLEQTTKFKQLMAQRQQGMPVAHIIGERAFWKHTFLVNPTTLIPRPDTEILVETALSLPLAKAANVLDLGTGTGAIALSLADERPQWHVTAVDKIAGAIELASANRDKLSLSNVTIKQSNWFAGVTEQKFQLIVSNPPYIEENDQHLQQGDVRFEPLSALTAIEDGFADLFYIATQAREYLAENSYLLLEHGYNQKSRLTAKLYELGYEQITTITDLGGNERCTLARWRSV